MISFDWRRFCETRGIHFVTSGKNVSGNRIAIHCPLCGSADPSQHMVLNLDRRKPYWSCWRNVQHRGMSPVFLVAKLAHVTMAQAREIVGTTDDVLDDEWSLMVARFFGRNKKRTPERPTAIKLPQGVRRLRREGGSEMFFTYLRRRGFEDAERLCREVELYYSLFGEFRYRLLFPVRVAGKLVNLVGRDITGRQWLRYKALPDHEAAADLATVVYNQDDARQGGRVLWTVEGPIDALKLLWYGSIKDSAVALFGMAKHGHIGLLMKLAPRYDLTMLALDNDAMSKSMMLRRALPGRVESCFLPATIKDVGAMTEQQVKQLVNFARSRLRSDLTSPTIARSA